MNPALSQPGPGVNIKTVSVWLRVLHPEKVLVLGKMKRDIPEACLRCGSVVKNLPAVQEMQEMRIQCLGWEDSWRRAWQSTPVFLPGESHEQRILAGSWGLQRVTHDWAHSTHVHEGLSLYHLILPLSSLSLTEDTRTTAWYLKW